MNGETAVAKQKTGRATGSSYLPAWKSESGFAILVTVLFLSFGCLSILRHEMWRDELQAWMIARDSFSVANLFYNLRYDGHPALWYLLLYFISRFTTQPCAMQVLHMLLGGAAVYVFVRFAPFARWQKAIFAFGYFPFYEYAVISRNYAIGVLLTFWFCALFPQRSKKLLPLSVILFLLANTSAYGCLMCISLGLTLLVACLADKRSRGRSLVARWKAALGIGVVVIGIAISARTMMPAAGSGVYTEWYFKFGLARARDALAAIAASHILIPDIFTQWRMGIHDLNVRPVQAVLGAVLLVYSLLLFARRPVVLFAYSATTAMFLALIYSKHPGTVRHHGHLFVVFILCVWLSSCYKERQLARPFADKLTAACTRSSSVLIPVLLCVQCAGGMAAGGRDVWQPFSRGKDVAEFIKANDMDHLPILGERDAPASAVTGYLNRRIYYPANGRSGTFIVFDQRRKRQLSDEELVVSIDKFVSEKRQDVLLILNYKLSPAVLSALDIRSVETFSGAIVVSENYWLYLVKCGKPGGERSSLHPATRAEVADTPLI